METITGEVFQNIMKNDGWNLELGTWKGLFRGNLVNVIRGKAIEMCFFFVLVDFSVCRLIAWHEYQLGCLFDCCDNADRFSFCYGLVI